MCYTYKPYGILYIYYYYYDYFKMENGNYIGLSESNRPYSRKFKGNKPLEKI